MVNILNLVKGAFSDGVITKLAGMLGSNSTVTQTAISRLLPSVMGGLIKKGSTEGGAQSLLNMIKDNDLGEGTIGKLSSLASGGDATDNFLKTGSKLNESLFGSSLKTMTAGTGLDAGASSKLLNMATPVVLGSLGKVVKAENLDAKGLQSFLAKQNDQQKGATSSATTHTAKHTTDTERAGRSGGGSIMKWLVPLFLLLSAAWFFLQNKNESTQTTNATATTQEVKTPAPKAPQATHQATHTHADGTVHEGHSHGTTADKSSVAKKATDAVTSAAAATAATGGKVMGLFVDDAGNLVKDGEILYKKGEFSIKDGQYLDASGKRIGLLEKVGQAIGDAGKAVGGAVAGAANKTADAFKDVFGGMFKKKAEGAAVSAYGLSQIKFDTESHKITSFSKQEVMGLAAALKAYPDSKIQVQVNTNDGADGKENEKLSKIRAEVVHDMLVTLGVSDKQISFKGMGQGADNVSITVQ